MTVRIICDSSINVRAAFDVQQLLVADVGPVLAAQTGPGVIALSVFEVMQ